MVFLSVGPQRGSTKALPIGRTQLFTRKTDEEFYASFGNIVGGVCSPVLANLALDDLEGELRRHFPSSKKGDHAQVHVVRYCAGTPVQA